MITLESLQFEIQGRLADLDLGKKHLSVRWEPAPGIVRVGVCLKDYNWESREHVLDALLDFELSHRDDFALEFDVIPLESVLDPDFSTV
jgi:hypothetical protein